MKRQLLAEDFNKLKLELDELESIKLPRAKKITKEAIDGGGGFHDNADYDTAWQNEQALLQQQSRIKSLLQNITIIEPDKSMESVSLGSTVAVKDLDSKEVLTVQLAGDAIALYGEQSMRVSTESPLGQALLDKRRGDEVTVTPSHGETITYLVLGINEGDDHE